MSIQSCNAPACFERSDDVELLIRPNEKDLGEFTVRRSLRSRLRPMVMIIGGEPFPEKRTIWWNFVPPSSERIDLAKQAWKEGRFEPVPGEAEFIPLPD